MKQEYNFPTKIKCNQDGIFPSRNVWTIVNEYWIELELEHTVLLSVASSFVLVLENPGVFNTYTHKSFNKSVNC